MSDLEEKFLSTYGERYGYGGCISHIRDTEFPNLAGTYKIPITESELVNYNISINTQQLI